MDKSIRLLLSLLMSVVLVPFTASAQSGIEQYFSPYGRVAQIEGTEAAVKSYFADIGSRSDTIYAYLYIPGQLPRLEFAMDKYDAMLKAADPDAEFVLVSVNCRRDVARKYNAKMGYVADFYLYDDSLGYLDFLSFNTPIPYGGYALKVDKAGGRVLCGGAFASSSPAFFDALVSFEGAQPFHAYSDNRVSYPMPDDVSYVGLDYAVCPIELPDSLYAIARVSSFSLKDDLLVVAEDFHDYGSAFRCGEDDVFRFVSRLEPDGNERYVYFDVPDSLFEVARGGAYYIPLATSFLPDGKIGLVIDLPRVFLEEGGGLAYFNQPVVLVRDAWTFEPCRMIELTGINDDMYEYIYDFSNVCVLDDDNVMISVLKLSWPELTREELAGMPANDCFKDEYYDSSNPCFQMMDRHTGRRKSRFGSLDEVLKATRCAAFHTHIAAPNGDEFAYANPITGIVHVADIATPDDVKDDYKVFDLDSSRMIVPDTAKFYTLDYYNDYNAYFCRRITSMKLRDDKLYVLVNVLTGMNLYDEDLVYEYREVDRSSGEVVTSFMVAKQSEDESVLSATLSDDAVPRIAYLSEEDGDYSIKFVTEAGR